MFHIGANELWDFDPRPTVEELNEFVERGMFGSSFNVSDEVRIMDAWPLYPRSPHFNGSAADMMNVPVLLMNGDLDSQTPLKGVQMQRSSLRGTSVVLKVLPGVGHGTAFLSPVKTPGQCSCSVQMLLSFVQRPGEVNDSCISDLLPLNFHVDSRVALSLLGVADAYEGTIAPAPSPTPFPPPPSDGIGQGLFWGIIAPLMAAVIVLGAASGRSLLLLRRTRRGDDVRLLS